MYHHKVSSDQIIGRCNGSWIMPKPPVTIGVKRFTGTLLSVQNRLTMRYMIQALKTQFDTIQNNYPSFQHYI